MKQPNSPPPSPLKGGQSKDQQPTGNPEKREQSKDQPPAKRRKRVRVKSNPYNRGRQIHYDHVPDDVWDKIQLMILRIKQNTRRGKVSMSAAITKLIRNSM